jgi:hypothetical protein
MITTNDALERVLRRCGDDLFRLAVLLAPDAARADAALQQAVRQLAAAPPPSIDERSLVTALLAATQLPRARGLPAWARAAAGDDGRLLARMAQLPVSQRLALGLASLRSFEGIFATAGTEGTEGEEAPSVAAGEADAAASRSSLSVSSVAADRQAALVALAAFALPQGETMPPLTGEAVPEDCRPARAALVRGDSAAHDDPAIRGHLALCAECRGVAQAWRQAETRVDEVLRAVLRDVQPPPGFAAHLRAAAGQQTQRRVLPIGPLVLRALVPLAVVLAILALVWPRGTQTPAAGETSGEMVAPHTLVERARQQLYAAPDDGGGEVWRGRYSARWYFGDDSYADLAGTLWLDAERGRHRLELVHEAGGGPFEFQLGNGRDTLWYSAEPRYAATIYPQIAERFANRAQLDLARTEQQEMLAARLGAGAWGLPAAYLRQAAAADDLRSWGRHTADDGAELAVLSFRGWSALAPPASGPADDELTLLLSIDTRSGALYEIRELIGPDAGEQTGRTVWRYLGGEWLERGAESEAAFEPSRLLRARGGYAQLTGGPAAPELPLVPLRATLPLAEGLAPRGGLVLAPADTPPGITSAALIGAEGRNIYGATLMYLGEGRRLAIRPLAGGLDDGLVPVSPDTEEWIFSNDPAVRDANLTSSVPVRVAWPRSAGETGLPDTTARVRPAPVQRYDALLNASFPQNGERYLALVSAQGFSREELLEVIRTLGPLSPEAVRRQTPLFVGRQYDDPEAFNALLDALADVPLPEEGQVLYTVQRTYARQAPAADALRDPYHLPLYAGIPETLLIESWTRVLDGDVEVASVVRDEGGTVHVRSYGGPDGFWTHDVPRGEVFIDPAVGYRETPAYQGTSLARQLLVCGAVTAEVERGEQVIMRSEHDWQTGSCAMPYYADLVERQRTVVFQRSDGGVIYSFASNSFHIETVPFLADIPGIDMNFRVWLGEDGRLARTEVRVMQPSITSPPVTVERWELLRQETKPAAEVPAAVFQRNPPAAIIRFRSGGGGQDFPMGQVDVNPSQARVLLGGPLFDLVAPLEATDNMSATLKWIKLSPFDPDGVYSSYGRSGDTFADALLYGAALRFDYLIEDERPGAGFSLSIYQGRAERFGQFLRARARWLASEPTTVTIDGRELQGWVVTTFDSRKWLLVENEGILLAMPANGPEQALVERLVQR